MNPSLFANKVPLTQADLESLRKLFSMPEYALLRNVLSAHCAHHQCSTLDAMMYANETADQKQGLHLEKARQLTAALNILDDLQANEEQWFHLTIEHRR